MKKVLSLIMCLVLMIGTLSVLSSCGNEKKDDGSNDGGEKKETFVCGVTIFEKMNEKDADGNWTGFETEFAQEVGKILGMDVKFQEIDWGQKYNELNSGAIDCIWNGFTANSSDDGIKRSDLVDFSYGYMLNQQCIVVKKDKLDSIKTEADLKGKTACVEGGSAGAAYAETVTDKDKVLSATAQINAFTEVKSGAADFIVVDILLAKNICGQGDYEDLAIVEAIELESEIYAIGFKKGSTLTAKVNAAIKELDENGKLMELAKKYGFENVLKVQESIEG
ncbi:MAG: transporter substrate-binding domain-containing protein [Ruminococcaceae bacterium]|nr:transporter substrate-binding domain-containing protein [Oscillospiraceae bacterium]